MPKHPLHEVVGKIVKEADLLDCKVVLSRECGGSQNIPLFCSPSKANSTEYCNVDLLITKKGEVRVIVEIEETNVTPVQICGKFLVSALTSYYIHNSEKKSAQMAESVLFIQIVDKSKLKESKTSKIGQWENLEKSISKILPIGRIKEYKLFLGNKNNLHDEQCMLKCIRDALK